MTELSQRILKDYQIRKSKKQKLAFISLLKEYFPELSVQEGGFIKSRNIIVGDINRAKVLLTAHYDTCAWLPIPNFVAPKNAILTILYSFIILIPMLLVYLGFRAVLNAVTDNFLIRYYSALLLWSAMLILTVAGPANRHTANDNTSGVIMLCQLLAQLTAEERNDVAFIFFDNEEIGLVGSSYFRQAYKKQLADKLLINFDCISDGDYIMLAASKSARKDISTMLADSYKSTGRKHFLLEKSERVYYPSDQAGYKKSIAVAALNRNRYFGYFMTRIHTHRDTIFDKENIHLLTKCTINFLTNYCQR